MTKSELIEQIAARRSELSAKEVEAAVRVILDDITNALAEGGRVEIRGFGSFSLHHRPARIGRNPNRPADVVQIPERKVVKFKPGKKMKALVLGS